MLNKKRSKSTQKKYEERKKTAKVENALEEQFSSGRVLGRDVYYTLRTMWPVLNFLLEQNDDNLIR